MVVDDHHFRRVATCLRRLVRDVQHGLAVAEHQQQKHSQHTEAHDEQRFVLLRPCPDRTGLTLVFNILVLCRQHRLGLHALRHQGSSSPFGGMDGSASHTLTGNDSVFTLVFNILVLCRQHRLGLHALRHQGSSSPFGGMDGSASHTLTGNDSVFTGHLGAWNRSAHNLPIRGERTLPPNTVKSLGCRV